jgi:tetratricopeptide (TPR) repeat protein
LGFEGVAHAALSDDFSRSVNAVADVWHTVLTASAEVANIGKPRFREYLVDAIGFYIDRGNKQETQHAFNRLVSLGLDSPDIRKQIADAYYDAGDFEEAIKAYKEILDIEPSRRDVVERIASYYMEQGDKALENGKLEESLSAYTEAAEADRLNTDAQAKRLEVEALLAARDARLTGAQSNLTAAQTLEDRAEEQSQAGDYPKAMDLLQQAKDLYDSVPPEFPTEYSLARARLTGVNQRMQQHQREFLSNAARLSGTGFATDARYRAATTQAGISEEDLRSIVSEQYTEEAQRLSREYQQSGAME